MSKRKKMEHYELFLETEKENISLSKKYYDKELGLYVECFNLLADTYRHISNILEESVTSVQVSILFNCARILNSSKVYIDLLMKGYYFDAQIIQRSLIENIYLIECFIKDEKYVDKWIDRELKFGKIKEELGLYSQEKFSKYWEELCDFVHANVPAILTLTEISEKPEVYIQYGPKFKSESKIALMFFPLIGYMTLSLIVRAFGNLMNPKVKNQIEKSLGKWKIEADKLCDKVDKESEKIGVK